MKIILKILDIIGALMCFMIFLGFCGSWAAVILRCLPYPYLWICGVFVILPSAAALPYKWCGGDNEHVFSFFSIAAGLFVALVAFLTHVFIKDAEGIVFLILTMACIALPWHFFMESFLRLKKEE